MHVLEIVVNLLAGLGAGFAIGFTGASAVVVTAPLLILFLRYPAYQAIGVALSIDVLASGAAILVYGRYGKIRVRQTLLLTIAAVVAAAAGSYVSRLLPSQTLATFSGIGGLVGGALIAIGGRSATPVFRHIRLFERYRTPLLLLAGSIIGSIAGIVGVGGGVMIVAALIIVSGFEIHDAIGTSVLAMMFIALVGGIAHDLIVPPPAVALAFGSLGGIAGALGSALLANVLSGRTLSTLAGGAIFVLGLALTFREFLL